MSHLTKYAIVKKSTTWYFTFDILILEAYVCTPNNPYDNLALKTTQPSTNTVDARGFFLVHMT